MRVYDCYRSEEVHMVGFPTVGISAYRTGFVQSADSFLPNLKPLSWVAEEPQSNTQNKINSDTKSYFRGEDGKPNVNFP